MAFKQKPLNEQVIVITGCTSGIGLATARMATAKGAKVILVARNELALRELAQQINSAGGAARSVLADVGVEDDLRRAAVEAIEAFGGFDTWVNNAGVSIYGELEKVKHADSRRLFETNFWGVVNGSIIAAKHFRQHGGTLINIGSTLSDVAIPVQGMYCASKHAVKGFTDALRIELEADDAPVFVTLVKPSAIDTPYKDHAKNYLDVRPENPPPVYSPEVVAETILHCAVNQVRDVFVGGGGKALSALGNFAPRTTDLIMEKAMIDMQKSDENSVGASLEGLYSSSDASLRESGGYSGHVAKSSVYTSASLHPVAAGAAFAVGVGVAFVIGKALIGASTATAEIETTANKKN